MSRKGIAIKRDDTHRILLTETLPFELPIFFTNQKLYDYAKLSQAQCPPLLRDLLKGGSRRIPYEYKIQRGDGRQRMLAIMHPASQLSFVDFYACWDAYILNQCAKSTFSLRRPIQVGSVYYEPHLKDEDEGVGGDVGDLAPATGQEQRTFASTYFYYARYNQIWKFFDSTEFRRIEQDFRSMRRLDISKCFQSIYSHSISWAIRSKEFAKKHQNATTFDSEFDRLIGDANWGETNGIIIGPEVSRIFAEIILQQIDANIRTVLEEHELLPSRVTIRRYVDDFFIFFNRVEDADLTQKCIEDCLDGYNMTLNESKTETVSSPLITNLSIARDSIKALLSHSFQGVFGWMKPSDGSGTLGSLNDRSADNLIRQIKSTIKTTGASYSTISPYALGIIAKILHRAARKLTIEAKDAQDAHSVYMSLSFALEVAFFVYRMDIRVNTTYKISSILIAVKDIAEQFASTGKIIRQEMVDHSASVLRQAHRAGIGDCEIASLLSATFFVGGPDAVDSEELMHALNMHRSDSPPNYFQIVTALYCAQDHRQHAEVHEEACRRALLLLKDNAGDSGLRTDLTLLFLDFVACPYVSASHKALAISYVSQGMFKQSLSVPDANAVRNFVVRHLGSCDWRADGLPALLRRKELKPAYD